MKLSEAIRLGAMLRPQGFDELIVGGASCAVGAAYEALGVSFNDDDPEDRPSHIIELMDKTPCVCPVCGDNAHALNHYVEGVGGTMAHLNDDHQWTREAIADWVESIERSLEPQSPAVGHESTVDDGREAVPVPQIKS